MLGNPWFVGITGVCAVFFGVKAVLVFPSLLRLIWALLRRSVIWPGPRILEQETVHPHDQQLPEPSSKPLFRLFVAYAMGALVATIILGVLFFVGFLQMELAVFWKSCYLLFLAILAFTWGVSNSRRAVFLADQVKRILDNRSGGGEPKQPGVSAESEYAIEHPLANHRGLKPETELAITKFVEATMNFQEGNITLAHSLFEQALRIAPTLHEDARTILKKMVERSKSNEAGAVFYWLGIHSEYMMDWRQAADWYEKAAQIYAQCGYPMRESRVHCNLGNVKMRLHDDTAMDEFEKAISLNPRNGTAHLNIARIYYGISGPGDGRYERALDAFAGAIIADPFTYGPKVIASLREIGYTWQEDLEKITQKVEKKRLQASAKQHNG